MLILLSALLLVAIILLIWMIRLSGTARRTALSTRENRVLLDGLSQKITESTQSVKSDLMGEVKSVRVECVDTVRTSVGELGRGLREEQKASAAAQKDQLALSDQLRGLFERAVLVRRPARRRIVPDRHIVFEFEDGRFHCALRSSA